MEVIYKELETVLCDARSFLSMELTVSLTLWGFDSSFQPMVLSQSTPSFPVFLNGSREKEVHLFKETLSSEAFSIFLYDTTEVLLVLEKKILSSLI